MKTIPVGKDVNGASIKKGDIVIADDGSMGPITEVYDNGCIDIHHANAHQGPVIDSFDIIGHNIMKFPQH